MKTIKASEVVKGMRVRVEESVGGSTITTEGPVLSVDVCNSEFTELIFDGTLLGIDPDHPVTVLAEPEPEWVEGAWYWTLAANQTTPRIRKRMERGWASVGVDGTSTVLLDNGAADFTVLGRVLIVDWPGDDVARELDAINDGNRSSIMSNYGTTAMQDVTLYAVADAIRTQGGVP